MRIRFDRSLYVSIPLYFRNFVDSTGARYLSHFVLSATTYPRESAVMTTLVFHRH